MQQKVAITVAKQIGRRKANHTRAQLACKSIECIMDGYWRGRFNKIKRETQNQALNIDLKGT